MRELGCVGYLIILRHIKNGRIHCEEHGIEQCMFAQSLVVYSGGDVHELKVAWLYASRACRQRVVHVA
jgi:hypothetical protein